MKNVFLRNTYKISICGAHTNTVNRKREASISDCFRQLHFGLSKERNSHKKVFFFHQTFIK